MNSACSFVMMQFQIFENGTNVLMVLTPGISWRAMNWRISANMMLGKVVSEQLFLSSVSSGVASNFVLGNNGRAKKFVARPLATSNRNGVLVDAAERSGSGRLCAGQPVHGPAPYAFGGWAQLSVDQIPAVNWTPYAAGPSN